MELNFSQFQEKAIKNIWQLGLILITLNLSAYFIYAYGPDTSVYKTIYSVLGWLANSLVFAWYFYKNNFFSKGVIVQLLFLPTFLFSNDISSFIDYYLSIDNIEFIYKIIPFFTFIIPLFCFTLFYFKKENAKNSTFKKSIPFFILVLVFSYSLDSDPDNLFSFVSILASNSDITQDIFVSIIFSLIALKEVCLLVGFYYISNRINAFAPIKFPLDVQPITSKMFLNSFVVGYTILLFVTIDLIKNIATFVFREINTNTVLYFSSAFLVLFVAGRFLGQLIQYRNYSLKKYFGILNLFLLIPVVNIVSLLILYFSKANSTSKIYIDSLNKKRIIHLSIYIVLYIAFTAYNYFKEEPEYRALSDFYYIPYVMLIVYLLSTYKWSTRVLFFATAIIYNFNDVKTYFSLTEGISYFFKEKVLSFAWLSGLSICLMYYVFYYLFHKSFYSSYFLKKEELATEEELKQFEL